MNKHKTATRPSQEPPASLRDELCLVDGDKAALLEWLEAKRKELHDEFTHHGK